MFSLSFSPHTVYLVSGPSQSHPSGHGNKEAMPRESWEPVKSQQERRGDEGEQPPGISLSCPVPWTFHLQGTTLLPLNILTFQRLTKADPTQERTLSLPTRSLMTSCEHQVPTHSWLMTEAPSSPLQHPAPTSINI